MSPLHFVIMLIIAIIILTVLTLKFKMHPVMVLFLTATFCGLASGKTLVDTFSSITKYFGSTLGSIGVMIIFGAVIASGINDTGAATSMVNFFIKKFKGKCLELAPALTGFIMSIPVFGDIAIILNAPISAILAKRKKLGMQQVAPFVNLGLRPVYAKGEYVAPLPQYTEGIEAVEDTNDVNALLIKEDNTPSSGASFLPLLLPAVMIAIGSIGKLFTEEGSAAYSFFNTFGNTVLALFIGIIAVGCLIFGRKDKVVKKANADGTGCKLTEKSSWFEIVMNNWVGRALQIAIGALLITAMGGAMGGILRENEAIATIGGMIAESSFPAVLVPFLMAAILMTVCGSMTTAAMTAAGLMGGLMTVLGLDPVLTTLAIGAGSMVGWHVNNSGFWIFTSLYGFDTKQGLKYFTTTNALGGIVAFIVLVILHAVGLV